LQGQVRLKLTVKDKMDRFAKLLVFFLSLLGLATALGQKATVGFADGPGRLLLGDKARAVKVIVDGNDWKGVKKVAQDLADDFGRVTGLNGSAITGGASCLKKLRKRNETTTATGGVIIAGTIGKSAIIDGLVSAGKIDVAATKGQWEAFSSQIVKDPLPGIAQALVIAGKLLNELKLGAELLT
jgi:hypothetical protein